MTNNAKIFDYFYKKFADHLRYKVADSTKSKRIDEILTELSWDDREVILARVRYEKFGYDTISRITGIPKNKLIKKMDIATRHMYSPKNISIAIPIYYNITNSTTTPLRESDFGNNVYIFNRLAESAITSREKLFRHLELGWYYLWTIPGIGDNSRQMILIAIDKWKEEKK